MAGVTLSVKLSNLEPSPFMASAISGAISSTALLEI